MTGTVTGWKKRFSEIYDREYLMLFIRLENGTNTLTCLDPCNRNYERWTPFIKKGVGLQGLVLLRNGKVDADSSPKPIPPPQLELF